MKKKSLFLMSALLSSALLFGCNGPIDNPEYTTLENGVQIINEATAKRAAAEKAKLNVEDIQYTKVYLDTDDGRKEYDIEFIHGGYEYEIEVDAEDGRINSYDRDRTEGNPQSQSTAPSESLSDIPVNENVQNSKVEISNDIGRDEALKAALKKAGHVNLSEADLKHCRIELDRDDGRFEYDVEFIYDSMKYDVTVDASNGKILEYEVSEQKSAAVSQPENPTKSEAIGENAALEAATEKANLGSIAKENLQSLRIELDEDDGRFEYDIEFTYNNTRYDVTVDADSGAIIEYETKALSTASETVISEKEALKIALEHAKLAEKDISGIHIEIDTDDGKKEYEVEFISGYKEYDYDIDAVSGEIRNFDRDAEHCEAPEYSKPEENEFISSDKAKAAAYAHAGVDEANVYDVDIELDEDNGVFKYELEFKSGNYEYEYDINALDGTVIRSEKDFDD